MDPRALVAAETAVTRRLLAAWRPLAEDLYRDVTALVLDHDFAAARERARAVDLGAVVDANRQWLRYHLLGSLLVGARMARPRGDLFVSAGAYEDTLNRVVDVMSASVRYRTSIEVMNALFDLIAEAEAKYNEPVVQKRFLHSLRSFKVGGDEALMLQSALHSSRLAVWGFTAEAEAAGVTAYRIDGVLDGRMCDYCRLVNGRVFNVADARARIVAALAVTDPMDLVNVHPWPDQSKASLKELRGLSSDDLARRGYSVPPFHPWDRCYLTLVPGQSVPAVGVGTQVPVRGQPTTVAEFAALGVDLSANDVDYWNDHVGVNPVDVMAALTGETPAAVLDAAAKAPPRIRVSADDGTVTVADASGEHVIDVVAKDLIATELGADAVEESAGRRLADILRNFLGNSGTAVTALGLSALVFFVSGGDSVYATALHGYVPEEPDWIDLSLDIIDDLSPGGLYAEYYEALAPYQQRLLMDILQSPEPSALLALVGLPWMTSAGLPLAEVLLHGRQATMTSDSGDPLQEDYFGDA